MLLQTPLPEDKEGRSARMKIIIPNERKTWRLTNRPGTKGHIRRT
jgi:hypothetical protein